jgi:hypothetical protein
MKTGKLLNCILFAAIPAIAIYSFSLIWLKTSGFSIVEILRDPAQQTGASSFIGFLSNIGVWLWVSATAISFFAAFALFPNNKNPFREFTILLGGLSLVLAVDDFFLIHDRYIPQTYAYLFYGIYASTLMVRHYKTILRVDVSAFLMAGAFMALSVFIDLSQKYSPFGYTASQVLEEGFKFTGGALWLYFCISTAFVAVSRPVEGPE